jgi:hypothetical protein
LQSGCSRRKHRGAGHRTFARAETGYGYIETGDLTSDDSALHVRRFIEKPNQNRAEEFVAAGNYYWNSGMFLWTARTLANAVREHLPETAPLLEAIAAAWGTPQFDEAFRTAYPKCENISVDYAVLEPRSAKGEHLSNLYCIPAEFSWNDLGSWASLYEYQVETRLRGDPEGNVADTGGHISIEANDNYIFSPKKFVALVGVENLVVVDTEDALLIAHRDHSQDVGKIVKELSLTGRERIDLAAQLPHSTAVQFLRISARIKSPEWSRKCPKPSIGSAAKAAAPEPSIYLLHLPSSSLSFIGGRAVISYWVDLLWFELPRLRLPSSGRPSASSGEPS